MFFFYFMLIKPNLSCVTVLSMVGVCKFELGLNP